MAQKRVQVLDVQPDGGYDTKNGYRFKFRLKVMTESRDTIEGEVSHVTKNPKYTKGDVLHAEWKDRGKYGIMFFNVAKEQPYTNTHTSAKGGQKSNNSNVSRDYFITRQVAVKLAVEMIEKGIVPKSQFFHVSQIVCEFIMAEDFEKFESDKEKLIKALFYDQTDTSK